LLYKQNNRKKMKIEVNRTEHPEGITFTVNVTEPHDAPFSEIDSETINFLEKCKKEVEKLAHPEDKLLGEVVNSIHSIKQRTFDRVKESLEFAIENNVKEKMVPICQEIYNWIYDNQKPYLKTWMEEFDPQRTKYYFDNDRTIESDYEED
jgi:hypothetical protein